MSRTPINSPLWRFAIPNTEYLNVAYPYLNVAYPSVIFSNTLKARTRVQLLRYSEYLNAVSDHALDTMKSYWNVDADCDCCGGRGDIVSNRQRHHWSIGQMQAKVGARNDTAIMSRW